jgi:hypothetical protein
MNIEELTALCEERGRAIYEANCHILQLTDSLNAATRERDEAQSHYVIAMDALKTATWALEVALVAAVMAERESDAKDTTP